MKRFIVYITVGVIILFVRATYGQVELYKIKDSVKSRQTVSTVVRVLPHRVFALERGNTMYTEEERKAARRASNREWYKRHGREYFKKNRNRIYAQNKEWYKNHKEQTIQHQLSYYNRNRNLISKRRFLKNTNLKNEVIKHYGGKCVHCGETDLIILSIDHIDGGGTKHQREIGWRSIHRWLKDNNYPSGFQVLCCNCNWRKYVESRMKEYNILGVK